MSERPLGSAQKARLIAAAEATFHRFGYRRTTVEDITKAAGIGKGSLYLHFTSKRQAYLAVVESRLEAFLAKASAVLHGRGSVPQRLRALVELTARHYGGDEILRASLFGDGTLVDEHVARLAARVQRQRIRQLLAEVLRAGQRDGTVRRKLDVDAAAAVLFEVGWAVVRAELEGESDLSLAVALDTLNQIVGLGVMTRHR